MVSSNYERLIQLAEEVFATKNDPEQLDVSPEVIRRLQKMHPATVSEYTDGNGPVAWVLLIPTTTEFMQQFLNNTITEKELFYLTPLDAGYEAIYLCSALILEEYRRRGIVKQLTVDAVEAIRKDHPVRSLFVWPFSIEGDLGAETIARLTSLPLHKKFK
jgi:hypothetical protein